MDVLPISFSIEPSQVSLHLIESHLSQVENIRDGHAGKVGPTHVPEQRHPTEPPQVPEKEPVGDITDEGHRKFAETVAKLALLDTAESMWEATMALTGEEQSDDSNTGDRVENVIDNAAKRRLLAEETIEIQQNQQQLLAVYGMMESLQHMRPAPAQPTSSLNVLF